MTKQSSFSGRPVDNRTHTADIEPMDVRAIFLRFRYHSGQLLAAS